MYEITFLEGCLLFFLGGMVAPPLLGFLGVLTVATTVQGLKLLTWIFLWFRRLRSRR